MTLTENQRLILLCVESAPLQIGQIRTAALVYSPEMSRHTVSHTVFRLRDIGLLRAGGLSKQDRTYAITSDGRGELDLAGRDIKPIAKAPSKRGDVVPPRTYVNSCSTESYVPPVWPMRAAGNREIASRGVRC